VQNTGTQCSFIVIAIHQSIVRVLSGPYLRGVTGSNPPRNAHLKNFQHYFSISTQLQYYIFFSPKAFRDTQTVLKGVCRRGSGSDPVGELMTLP